MRTRKPILLSFYALSNGKEALIFGQITQTRISDLSFIDYSRRRTFRTLLALYRTRFLSNHTIRLEFDSMNIETSTDETGAFFIKHRVDNIQGILQRVILPGGTEALMMEGLYSKAIHYALSPLMIVSDIDDTLLHSHIGNRIKKLRTLMFTPVERRRAVEPMQDVMKALAVHGATAVYLSNSEQNLYPLIYRFLVRNNFPSGPLFLRQLRKLRDVFRYRRLNFAEIHKTKILEHLLPMFQDKKFALVGDNTQQDLAIYLDAASKFPDSIKYILIRKVANRPSDKEHIREALEKLKLTNTELLYATKFPSEFSWS
jgi:phosphatidate phosphatase APP1